MPTAADQVGQYVHACGAHMHRRKGLVYTCSFYRAHLLPMLVLTYFILSTTFPLGAICLISCMSAYRVVYFNNTCIIRITMNDPEVFQLWPLNTVFTFNTYTP